MLAAAAVLLTGFVNISPSRKESLHLRPPAIGRTVMVETQRRSPVAKAEAPAKDVSADVATAKADAKKSKHYRSKVVARQRNNYGYGNALGYAEQPGYGPRGPFFQ